MIPVGIVCRIPVARVMTFATHEHHGRAGDCDVQRPAHSRLRPSVPVLTPCNTTSYTFNKIAVFPQVPGSRLIPIPDSLLVVIVPLIEDLIVRTQQIPYRTPCVWIAQAVNK